MKYRRYAIGALGYIGDRAALPTLSKILEDKSELDYFRADALQAAYQIDRTLGKRLAPRHAGDSEYLAMIAAAISRDEPWLTEPSTESEP